MDEPRWVDVVQERPFNAETPWAALLKDHTPVESFFVRNHFQEPSLDPKTYHLRITGEFEKAKALTLAQLQALPQRHVTSVLECAGNGRSRANPRPPGVAWGERAVGCATWEGPSLADVLRASPPSRYAVEVVFRGADLGIDGEAVAQYERSLPPEMVGQPDILLALKMNGQPLTRGHGGPVRLIVPGWYGMASVKWLTDIRYVTRPFTGWFQVKRYVLDDGSPIREVRPRALLLRPHPGEPLLAGHISLEGKAWAAGGVEEVVAQVNEQPWQKCDLGPATEGPHAWRGWRTTVFLEPGEYRVRVRARGGVHGWQPMQPEPNQQGYGINPPHEVPLLIGGERIVPQKVEDGY